MKMCFFFAPWRPFDFAQGMLGGRNFLMGSRRREDAILLYCLDRALDGARADLQVPESDFSHDFIAGHERDPAGIDARDSRLRAGHGDG
jgi:hypothetical protein